MHLLAALAVLAASPGARVSTFLPASPDGTVGLAVVELNGAGEPLRINASGQGPGLMVVLSGAVTLSACTGPMVLHAGETALVEGHLRENLKAVAAGSATLLVAYTTSGEVAPRPCHRGEHPSPFPFVLVRRSPERWPVPGLVGAVELYAGQHLGDRVSLSRLTLHPDAGVPRHLHAGSTELLVVTRGEGTLTVADAGRDVSPGALFEIPKDTWHEFHAGGTTDFVAWQLYSPAGPEQRFRKPDAGRPADAGR